MRPEDILFWLRAEPFVPFRIVMNSGRVLEVRHPEVIRVMRTSLIYFIPSVDRPEIDDRAEMIGLVLIERIEPMQRPSPQPAEGQG